MSYKQKRIVLILPILFLFLSGICIMAYPILSTAYMDSVRSEVHTQYVDQISVQDTSQLDAIRASAVEYNRRLFSGELSLLTPEENGYYEEMIIPDVTNVMGYVTIPRLAVELPIFHGVGNDALSTGCGHMPQSSLPVGGASTHAVISAHTGMANSKMFTDLPLMQPGDLFQLDVLGETLTYQILSDDDIQTVLPQEVSKIRIRPGEDLCTLVTCTPFGVNTHRLLVTGHRIPTPVIPEDTAVAPDSMESPVEAQESLWVQEYWHSVGMGLLIIGACMLPMAGYTLFHKLHRKK